MGMDSNEVIAALNDLIVACRDAQEGHRTAAERIGDDELRAIFHQYAEQRARFVQELQGEVQRLGAEPDGSESTGSALRRGLSSIGSIVAGNDDDDVIAECEQSEEETVRKYEQMLAMDLPPAIHGLVAEQYEGIREAHDRIRALERRGE